jgi:phospholipid/cholesterol/gamma-HCH transport system substrate-binding protein
MKVASQGLSRMVKDIEAGKGSLGKLVRDESLYNEAKSTLTQAREALGGFQTMSKRISDGKGTLGRLLNDESLYTDMQGAVTSLGNIMKRVERGEGTLGKLLTDDSLFFTTKDSLKRVGKAADQLREQGPLSIIGLGIQALGAF